MILKIEDIGNFEFLKTVKTENSNNLAKEPKEYMDILEIYLLECQEFVPYVVDNWIKTIGIGLIAVGLYKGEWWQIIGRGV